MKEFAKKILELTSNGQNFVVVTVIKTTGSTPRKAGAKMIVGMDGKLLWGTIGGGTIEYLVLDAAKDAIEEGIPVLLDFSLQGNKEPSSGEEMTGMFCGGKMTVFLDIPHNPDRLIIVGSGHIARELCPLAVKSGFHVIVIDDRVNMISSEIFPTASMLIPGDFRESIESFEFSEKDYVVIITYCHATDQEVLETCLKKETRNWKYIGMIGSKRKKREIFLRLQEKGIERTVLDQVHAPIGIFKAQTPFNIAVSILGELITIRNQKE
ncbi:MAG: XdhC family protein [Candidatus Hodarchaeales archaeon]|jgi:xanthine dehydrogenase accessory factor